MGRRMELTGRLEVITGCMFSGKSEELIRRLRRARIAQLSIQVFKPAIDNRFSIVEVVSHNGGKIEAIPVSCSREILEKLKKDVKVIGIDEGQFFDTEVIKIIRDLIKQNKIVIVAGLDMDFRGEPFGPMPELMAMADEVLKLHAICVICGDDATMTQRIINGKPAHYSDPTILIGAEEKYEARCRQHHEVIE